MTVNKGDSPGKKVNVLRVCDFPSQISARNLYLPARQFYYDLQNVVIEEISSSKYSLVNINLQLENFETCLAAAAYMSSDSDAMLGAGDDWWYFLSEVEVQQGKAKLSFSLMENGSDFVQ